MDNFIAHILVVDDDDGIRELVKEYLTQNNFLVSTSNSAEDALEKVKIIKFDLIVCLYIHYFPDNQFFQKYI